MKKGLQGLIDLFKAGTHTSSEGVTKTYTHQDLEEIASKYNSNRDKHEAPIVVGHPDLNSPAWGWLDSLEVVGDVLKGRFKQIAPAFAQAVEDGRFKKRSIKLHKKYGITHVGFLGAVLPAVEGLEDIGFNADSDNEDAIEVECSYCSFIKEKPMVLDEAKAKELQRDNEAMKAKIKELEAANKKADEQQFSQKLSDAEKENAELKQKLAKVELDNKRKGYEEFCSSISEQLAPKHKDTVIDIMMALDSVGDYEFSRSQERGGKKSLVGEFQAVLKDNPKVVEFDEITDKGKAGAKYEPKEYSYSAPVDPEYAALDQKVRAYQKANNVEYEKALNVVLGK